MVILVLTANFTTNVVQLTSQQSFLVFQDVFKTSSRRLQSKNFRLHFPIRLPKTSSRRLARHLQDVFKTSCNYVFKASSRRLQDVFSTSSPRRMFAGLYNRFTKKEKEEFKGKIDIYHVRAAAWDKVIAFMNETLPSIFKRFWVTWVRKYIPWLFIRVRNFHREWKHHITQFGENLMERAPEYEVIKHDKKQRAFCKESMHEMFSV